MILFLKWVGIIVLYILVVGYLASRFFNGVKIGNEDEDN